MICQASIKALDARDGVVSETTIPASDLAYVTVHMEEFTDRLERRGVRFSRVVVELVPTVQHIAPQARIGGYLALFPELLGAA